MEKMYIIYDTLAKATIGQVQLFRHDAAAIRFFNDVAQQKQTIVGQHPTDFELIALGIIDEEQNILALREVVLTGRQWLAMQEKNTTEENE